MDSLHGNLIPLIADPNPNRYRVAPPAGISSLSRSNSLVNTTSNTTINVNYSGFTPQAQAAFQYAVDIWESVIDSSVPIEIDASFSPLGTGVLGQAGPDAFYRNFTNAPQNSTWYPVALANSRAGTDLNGAAAEISAEFSSNFGNWYYGTDGNTPNNQYDFATVVLHEIGHGLGFIGFWEYNNGQGKWGLGTGFPSAFDRFVENGSGQSLINTSIFPNPSTALGSQLTSNNVFFDGPSANAANGGNRISLYAPSIWSGGSSISHLGEVFNNTPNALMTYAIGSGETIHNPGPVTLGMFADMGWQLANSNPPPTTPVISLSVAPNSVTEDGNTNLVYTFNRTGNLNSALNVNLSVAGTAAFNNDYTQTGASSFDTTTGIVNFAAGSATTTVTIDPTSDSLPESNETAILTLSSGTGYTVGSPNAATGTITNDDSSTTPTISLSVSPTSVTENGSINLVYTFNRTGDLNSALNNVNVRVGGTATFNNDYTQTGGASWRRTSGKVNFAAGSATATVTVDPIGDARVESNETVLLTLSSGTGYTVGSPNAATGTINNDDPNSNRGTIIDNSSHIPELSLISGTKIPLDSIPTDGLTAIANFDLGVII
ncbi:Calx-beta domain-containing protein [Gloeocapsa sp. PCC 73106]|uniref:Calx-beta domain-containing protein n=1 Tax=Gloeocapsa sp. PCC 73106 TaxID=102232 RepID=UPI0002ACC047|nr:Calx-beta domain-containing protein [Gloeocapsa sp. PCC 73106]ELR99941.1 hypothetical protein GLO73106DRAFT_00037940 [Gloeocapsa sp. PCC 73106]